MATQSFSSERDSYTGASLGSVAPNSSAGICPRCLLDISICQCAPSLAWTETIITSPLHEESRYTQCDICFGHCNEECSLGFDSTNSAIRVNNGEQQILSKGEPDQAFDRSLIQASPHHGATNPPKGKKVHGLAQQESANVGARDRTIAKADGLERRGSRDHSQSHHQSFLPSPSTSQTASKVTADILERAPKSEARSRRYKAWRNALWAKGRMKCPIKGCGKVALPSFRHYARHFKTTHGLIKCPVLFCDTYITSWVEEKRYVLDTHIHNMHQDEYPHGV
jgi:hypothetical protein